MPERDWNARFHEMFDPLIVTQARAKQTAAAERVADALPTHLESYASTYVAAGYPDFAVRREGDGLQARTVGSLEWSELRHYHYDVFEWHLADLDVWTKVRFLIDDNGDLHAISIPIEPEVDNVVFTRKLPQLTDDLLAILAGEYDPPIDGIVFTITQHEGKLFAETGQPAEEIKLYKVTDDLVGFRLKRTRFDFVREDGRIRALIVKSHFMTVEAPRAM